MRHKGKWFDHKIININEGHIKHIFRKNNITGKILKYPSYNSLTDTYEFGIIYIDKINKKFRKYISLFEHNDFLIVLNNKFIFALAYMGVYIDEKYIKYLR